MTSRKIGILLINDNNAAATLKIIKEITDLKLAGWRLFLLDNGCQIQEQTAKYLFDRNLPLIYTEMDNTTSRINGFNVLFSKTKFEDCDWLWLIDGNKVPTPNQWKKITKQLKRADLGILGLDFGADTGMRKSGRDWQDWFSLKPPFAPQREHFRDTGWLNGISCLIKGKWVKSLGGFEENYYRDFALVDWCLKIKKAGDKIRIGYFGREKSNHRVIRLNRFLDGYFTARNPWLYAKKNGGLVDKVEIARYSTLTLVKLRKGKAANKDRQWLLGYQAGYVDGVKLILSSPVVHHNGKID
jgi:hypothetical protein